MWLATNSGPFELREINVSGTGLGPLRILHISDIHFAPGQTAKAKFLAELAQTKPDLVVNTGDNLGHERAVNPLLAAIEPLLDFPGVFVHGSNDYFAPMLKNPAGYLLGPSKKAREPKPLDTERLTREFEGAGWLNLNNASGALELAGKETKFIGTDDAHIDRAKLTELPYTQGAIAVTHAPYQEVLNGLVDRGAAIIFAGHTHGGQICLPGGRAIVTNCDLDRSRASGLSNWNGIPLHVSGGIGCSIYAPVRMFCPPSATLVTLS